MYFQPLEGPLGPSSLSPLGELAEGADPLTQALAPGSVAGDAISRLVPPLMSNVMGQNPLQTAMFGPLAGLLQQLMQMLQTMMGYGSGGCSGYGNEQFFPNATGGSNGDPHLSFNGSHWNSMTSQPDLLDSDSFRGGFRVSTEVTPPNSRGVTWNQSATVSLNGGATTVSLNNAGQPSISSYGQQLSIADGQTLELGNGASVTRNQNGSLTVVAQNGAGGQIATTLSAQGQGVNVDVNAQNVDLGGALVNGAAQQPPISGPIPSPIPFPLPTPFPTPFPPIPAPIGSPVGPPIRAPFPPILRPPTPVMHPDNF